MNAQITPPKFTQLIKITPDGSIHGLEKKPGQGIDLKQFGSAKVERVSDIKFDSEEQKWYITFLRGELEGFFLTKARYEKVVNEVTVSPEDNKRLQFVNYDDAVASEIVFLDAARTRGLYPLLFQL